MKEIKAYSAKKTGVIMLNANELYQNLSSEVMGEIQVALLDIAFNRYPDETSRELIEAYATVMNLNAKEILAGNGSDEMLGLMIQYFLGKGKTLYTLAPDFSMYDYYATMQDAAIVKYACDEDGHFSVSEFIEKGRRNRANMILFSNPNNPTGHYLNEQQIIEIVEAFPTIPVIIDEAYGEFAKGTLLSYINVYQNLYVTRTLSKAFGLAGARLGFLISNATNIAQLKPFVVPYNISTITQKIGSIVLAHADEYTPIIQAVKQARDDMYDALKDMKRITFYPSQANYLYGRSGDKAQLLDAFTSQGIQIRDYKDDSFRITIGNDEENAMVQSIIKRFDKEECSV